MGAKPAKLRQLFHHLGDRGRDRTAAGSKRKDTETHKRNSTARSPSSASVATSTTTATTSLLLNHAAAEHHQRAVNLLLSGRRKSRPLRAAISQRLSAVARWKKRLLDRSGRDGRMKNGDGEGSMGQEGDETMMLLVANAEAPARTYYSGDHNTQGPPGSRNSKPAAAAGWGALAEELLALEREWREAIATLRESVDHLEHLHNNQLEKCNHRVRESCLEGSGPPQSNRHLQGAIEELRLSNALAMERFNSCTDYLDTLEALLSSRYRISTRCSGDTPSLLSSSRTRRLIFATARRQLQRNQLADAVDQLSQLVIATGGRLHADEMRLLYHVYKKKLVASREFHSRLSGFFVGGSDGGSVTGGEEAKNNRGDKAIPSFEDSTGGGDCQWATLVGDLRNECSELYDTVVKIQRANRHHETSSSSRPAAAAGWTTDSHSPPSSSEASFASSASAVAFTAEVLTRILAANIAAFWLHLTPSRCEEHEEVGDLVADCFRAMVALLRQCTSTITTNSSTNDTTRCRRALSERKNVGRTKVEQKNEEGANSRKNVEEKTNREEEDDNGILALAETIREELQMLIREYPSVLALRKVRKLVRNHAELSLGTT